MAKKGGNRQRAEPPVEAPVRESKPVAAPTQTEPDTLSAPAVTGTVSPAVKGWTTAILICVGFVSCTGKMMSIHRQPDEPPSPQQQQQKQAVVAAEEVCTKTRPCSPIQQVDGSTTVVKTKEGTSLCFDSSFFTNLSRLGYTTSYQGGTEMKPGCTTQSCSLDSFRFTPEEGVPLPNYWFVPEGSKQC